MNYSRFCNLPTSFCLLLDNPINVCLCRWVNLRKAFANFYRTHQTNPARSPGLQVMLSKLDLEFQVS